MTQRQRQVFDYVRDFIAQRRHAPSFEEVGDALGISKTTVFTHVHALEQLGYLRVPRPGIKRLARGMEIIGGDPCPTCGRRPELAGGAQ